MNQVTEKYCAGCGLIKTSCQFYPAKKGYLGLDQHCKRCRNIEAQIKNVFIKPEKTKHRNEQKAKKLEIAKAVFVQQCCACGEIKTLDQYSPSGRVVGRKNKCRRCSSRASAVRHAFLCDEIKDRKREYTKYWIEKNKEAWKEKRRECVRKYKKARVAETRAKNNEWKNTPAGKAARKRQKISGKERLADWYVRNSIKRSLVVKSVDIPIALVEAERFRLMIKKELLNENS